MGAGEAGRGAALNRWLAVILVAQLAFGLLAMTISIPSMQDWPATFGASQPAVQLTFSGFVAAYGGLQLVFGPWSDRIGRKPLLLLGLALAGAGSVLAVFASTLEVLTLARVVQGAGAAAGMVIGRAMVQDLYAGPERTRMMAFIGMTMGVCPPLAMVVGGQLHVAFGWQANFVLMAAMAAVLLVAAWWVIPARRPEAAAGASGWGELLAGYGRLLCNPVFLLYAAILASATATFYSFLGGAPLVLKGYGVMPDQVGWYIMAIPIAYIGGNLLTSRLVHRRRDGTIMWLGQVFNVGGLATLLALGLAGALSPLALALPLLLVGVGHGLLAPPTLAATVGLMPALAGSAAAVAGLMQQMAGAVGGYVVGLVPHDGQVNLALIMLGWTALGLLAHFLLVRAAPQR